MNDDVHSPEPSLTDIEDDADESDTDDSFLADRLAESEVPQAEDASFASGVDLPAAPRTTKYSHLLGHFRQQDVLYQSFIKSFRICSFMSSPS